MAKLNLDDANDDLKEAQGKGGKGGSDTEDSTNAVDFKDEYEILFHVQRSMR